MICVGCGMCMNYSDFHVGKVFKLRVNNEKENNNTQTKRKTVIDSNSNFRPTRIISELMSWRFFNDSLHALTGVKQLAGGFIFSPPFLRVSCRERTPSLAKSQRKWPAFRGTSRPPKAKAVSRGTDSCIICRFLFPLSQGSLRGGFSPT